MSPDAYVCFDSARRLLCGFPGQSRLEPPTFVWSYTVFERHLDEAITPSMYHFMSGYIQNNITKTDLWDIQTEDYCDGHIEAMAVDAYFALPIHIRISMHEQELVNLRAAKRAAEAKESAAIDAMLEENKPFDDTSPIAHEYAGFMRGVIAKARKEVEKLDAEIHEEEQWRGGYEEGCEDDLGARSGYDPMDEY
jgi:hypothetical protein